eukprot:CAMPEP_0170498822 /NCGR_PEP_ID=MMETSP0208-20121228/29110_1 /TAXON_ID=197538 /ORGANISM="Strombidium inclinatum, Strain S3" /LENGTH=40 /DNA_ID= /DNA_START= /DNA_END= /DNA_ORIENTATION=
MLRLRARMLSLIARDAPPNSSSSWISSSMSSNSESLSRAG